MNALRQVIFSLVAVILIPTVISRAEEAAFTGSNGSHLVKPQQLTSPDQVPEGLGKSDWQSIRAADHQVGQWSVEASVNVGG